MRPLSKSKLVAFRQCPKRLWLEIHKPELAKVSATSEAIFRTGHEVGELAMSLYDPAGMGVLIKLKEEGVAAAVARTTELLQERCPIFEAGFSEAGGLAFCDVLLPESGSQSGWRMIEVKASGSVKDYQRDDVAIQSYIARAAGLELSAVSLAHIDTGWTYPGGGDYRGLLKEVDLSAETFAKATEVQDWINDAHAVAWQENPPDIATGSHCSQPVDLFPKLGHFGTHSR